MYRISVEKTPEHSFLDDVFGFAAESERCTVEHLDTVESILEKRIFDVFISSRLVGIDRRVYERLHRKSGWYLWQFESPE